MSLGRRPVERRPRLTQQQDKVARLLRVGGVLPVDVEAVEAEVLNEFDSGVGKGLAAAVGGGRDGEVGAVGPAADGEEDLEVAAALLQEEELLDAAVDVGARVVPAVGGVVLVGVGPGVGEVDFSRLGADVGEGVEDVGYQGEGGDEGGRVVFATVDGPVGVVDDGSEARAATHGSGGVGVGCREKG